MTVETQPSHYVAVVTTKIKDGIASMPSLVAIIGFLDCDIPHDGGMREVIVSATVFVYHHFCPRGLGML